MHRATLTMGTLLALAAPATAQPLDFTIDRDRSTISVTLSVPLIGSDTDSTPVAGFFLIAPDLPTEPSLLTLLDYEIIQQETIDLDVSNFLGGITATASDIVLSFPPGASPVPSEPVVSGQFTFLMVPADTQGMISFDASGLVCASLESAGLPCSGTTDLAKEFGEVLVPELTGTYSVEGDAATIDGSFSFTQPFDEKNPDLGEITIEGTIVATAPLPSCPADLTGPGGGAEPDGNLTADDFFFYLGLFAAGDPAADLTGPGGDGVPDGSVTADDFFFYLGLFAAGCP